MAAPVNPDRKSTLAPRPFFDDAHWKKFKSSIERCEDMEAWIHFRDSYQAREIGPKIDQFLLELAEEGKAKPILSLVSLLEKTKKNTELSRICEVGAAILLSRGSGVPAPKPGNPNIPLIAKGYAEEYRHWGWEKRAAFMDMISKE